MRSSGRWSSKVQSSLVYKAHSREVMASLSLSCLIATIVNHHNTGTQEKEKQSETCKLLYSVLSVNLQGCSDDSLCRLIQWSEAPVYLFRKAKVPASMQNFLPSLVSCNWHHLSKSTALWSKRWSCINRTWGEQQQQPMHSSFHIPASFIQKAE